MRNEPGPEVMHHINDGTGFSVNSTVLSAAPIKSYIISKEKEGRVGGVSVSIARFQSPRRRQKPIFSRTTTVFHEHRGSAPVHSTGARNPDVAAQTIGGRNFCFIPF